MRSAFAALLVLDAGLASAAGIGPDRASELERLVRQDCGACHGHTLAGGLGTDIRGPALDGHTPESLTAIILDGIPGTAMPPWRPLLTQTDAEWISDYLLEGQDE